MDTATVAPTPTEPPPPANDPNVAVASIVQACAEKDGERLRTLVAVPVDSDELDVLFARGSSVRLLSQTIPEGEGSTTEVTVRLVIDETEQVERTWQLVLGEDGRWRATTLPDCY